MNTKERIFRVFANSKKYILILLVLLTAFSLITLTNLGAQKDTVSSKIISAAEFEALGFVGYDLSTDSNGNRVYTPNNDDPSVHLSLDGSSINAIKICFKSPVQTNSVVQVYYSLPGENLSEGNSRFGALSPNRDSVLVFMPSGGYTFARLDINTSFSIDSLEVSSIQNSSVSRTLSIPALVLLLITALIFIALLVFERKIGFYSHVLDLIKAQASYIKDCLDNRRFFRFALRITSLTLTVTLFISYLVGIALSALSPAFSIFLLVLSVLTLTSFIADSAVCNKKAAVFFLATALIIGAFISYSQPPVTGICWDDQIHYNRTVNYKSQILRSERTIADNSLANLIYPFSSYYARSDEFLVNLLAEDTIKIATQKNEDLNLYSSLGYLPSAIAMAICELLGADIIKTVVISRLANVILYAALFYFALKMLNGGALIFASIALMPTAIFLSASFSCDSFITAFIALGTAHLISVFQDKEAKFTMKKYAVISALFIVGCAPKAIYFFLLFPLLFVPKNKFDSKKTHKYAKLIAILSMLVILASFIVPFLSDTDSRSDYRGGSDVNALEQLKFILNNPFKYSRILLNFLGYYVSFENATLYSTAYSYLGFSYTLYGTLALLVILFCIFTDKSENDEFSGLLTYKATTLFAAFAQLALVATSLYISFTPVAHTSIGGCQYRYIIPILFAACYSLGSVKIRNNIDKRILNTVIFALLSFTSLMTYYKVWSLIIPA